MLGNVTGEEVDPVLVEDELGVVVDTEEGAGHDPDHGIEVEDDVLEVVHVAGILGDLVLVRGIAKSVKRSAWNVKKKETGSVVDCRLSRKSL